MVDEVNARSGFVARLPDRMRSHVRPVSRYVEIALPATSVLIGMALIAGPFLATVIRSALYWDASGPALSRQNFTGLFADPAYDGVAGRLIKTRISEQAGEILPRQRRTACIPIQSTANDGGKEGAGDEGHADEDTGRRQSNLDVPADGADVRPHAVGKPRHKAGPGIHFIDHGHSLQANLQRTDCYAGAFCVSN